MKKLLRYLAIPIEFIYWVPFAVSFSSDVGLFVRTLATGFDPALLIFGTSVLVSLFIGIFSPITIWMLLTNFEYKWEAFLATKAALIFLMGVYIFSRVIA